MPDSPEPTRYLQVIGRFYPDGRLWLMPGYLRERAPWLADERAESELVAAVLDERGAEILAVPMRLQHTCGEGGTDSVRAVRGWIPFPPTARAVEFRYRERVIHRVRRSESGPRLRVTWQPPQRASGVQRVMWTTEHPEGLEVECFIRYSHTAGERWTRISGRTRENSAEIDFDQLPGGDRCLLAIVATDGINTVIERTQPFAVAQKPCQAIILLPVDGSRYGPGQRIQLTGNGYWLEEVRPEKQDLRWMSSRDGELGRGQVIVLERLSPGAHEITLVAGSGDREGNATVRIQINEHGSGA